MTVPRMGSYFVVDEYPGRVFDRIEFAGYKGELIIWGAARITPIETLVVPFTAEELQDARMHNVIDMGFWP